MVRFHDCVLTASVMGVFSLSHPMSLYNYYITTTNAIIITTNIILVSIAIIMSDDKIDCKTRPHTEETANDDDILNSTDVQILSLTVTVQCNPCHHDYHVEPI